MAFITEHSYLTSKQETRLEAPWSLSYSRTDWNPSVPIKASLVHEDATCISCLPRYIESDIPDRVQPPPPSIIIKHQIEYEIEDILDSKVMRKRLFNLIKWNGYLMSDNSWESAFHLFNAKDLINSFHA